MPPKSKSASNATLDFSAHRLPVNINLPIERHKQWMNLLNEAEELVSHDIELQKDSAKGLHLKPRKLPVEVLGGMYAQYCTLINKIYDTYVNSYHLQRSPYLLDIVAVITKRMYELRNELVHYIVNDYIYVDLALIQQKLTPYDIQIVVPYHIPLEARPPSMEQLLQKMWDEAIRRKKRQEKHKTKAPTNGTSTSSIKEEVKEDDEMEIEEVEESESESTVSEHLIVPQETPEFTHILLIQKHERFRQYFVRDRRHKFMTYNAYFKPQNLNEASEELKDRAAKMIQKYYREVMRIKRQRLLDYRRDVLLGIVPDIEKRPLNFHEANKLLLDKRYKERQKIEKSYKEATEKEREKQVFFKKGELIEHITDEVIEWFKEWYFGYGFFPNYPYASEGGTTLVATGQYPTVKEQKEEDEKIMKATKGKTKDQLKQEKQQAKEEAVRKAEMNQDKAKKEKQALFKARCNPETDPGYQPQTSEFQQELVDALRKYRIAWSLYDTYPPDKWPATIYGFLAPVLTEDVMKEIHLEARQYVDEMMRLELQTFITAQKAMYAREKMPWPKRTPRIQPKKPKQVKELIIDKAFTKKIEPVFDLEIMSRPTTKLDDVIGEFNLTAYEANLEDPHVKFPSPCYGDVRQRLLISCIFGSGIVNGAKKNRSVLLLGIPRNGKSFLVDAVCGEMNAVKFDISPDVFCTKVTSTDKMLTLIFQAARAFQPSVIFLKNIERVPPQEQEQKAESLKTPLGKLLKTIQPEDKVIFIATCSNPFVAKTDPMMKLFTECILVPCPDYGTLQRFLYDRFQSIRSMPRDFCVQPLAHILRGVGIGVVIEMFNKVMTPERIIKLNVTPLDQCEFVDYMIRHDIEQMPVEEYEKYTKLLLNYSPLKEEREEYDIINTIRAEVYEKLKVKDAKKPSTSK